MSKNSANKKKYFIYSTASGCTSSLWESAVYDDYYKRQGMERVYSESEADYIVVNTCSVTPAFERRSENYIKKASKNAAPYEAGEQNGKKVIAAGCYSAIRQEKIKSEFSNVTPIKPLDMKTLSEASGLSLAHPHNPADTNRFDDIGNCKSSLPHKIIWFGRRLVRKFYGLFGKSEGRVLNFLDAMIFSDDFHVIEVGHGCAGGCTFCSIKQSRGFVKSQEESLVTKNLKEALAKGKKNFWLLATDLGAWGLDRQKDPALLMGEVLEVPSNFRMVINYIEPRWLLTNPRLFDSLEDKRIIGVSIPIQSGNSRLVFDSGRRYDPADVLLTIKKIKSANPGLMVKTNFMAGLPGESWSDFWDSAKAIFSFDIIVPVIFGVRPGTKAEKTPENHVGAATKLVRMAILSVLAMVRHFYVLAKCALFDFKILR